MEVSAPDPSAGVGTPGKEYALEYRIERLALPQIEEIYARCLCRHFPPDEVKPLKNIQRMYRTDSYRAYAMYGGELTAYAFLATAPECDLILLDYFAVSESCRGQGMGGLFLRKLQGELSGFRGILIETEDVRRAKDPSELSTRQRRDRFYERNGARRTRVRCTVYGVCYAVWNLPLSCAADDALCQRGMERIYRTMIPGEKYDSYVTLERI